MKWYRKPEPPAPKEGDTRTRRVFALLPTRVGRFTVWLEEFEITEVYKTESASTLQYAWVELERGVLTYTRGVIPDPTLSALADRIEALLPPPKHVCGLQGFSPWLGDRCPACRAETGRRQAQQHFK